jgi:hypothetical protein
MMLYHPLPFWGISNLSLNLPGSVLQWG